MEIASTPGIKRWIRLVVLHNVPHHTVLGIDCSTQYILTSINHPETNDLAIHIFTGVPCERPVLIVPKHPFAQVWKVRPIQQILVSHLATRDLAALRLVCHKFAIGLERCHLENL
jgi:hypothetical protein